MFISKLKAFTYAIAFMALLVLYPASVLSFSGGLAISKKTAEPITIDGNLNDAAWLAVQSDFENDNSPGVLGELKLGPGVVTAVTPMEKITSTWGNIKLGK